MRSRRVSICSIENPLLRQVNGEEILHRVSNHGHDQLGAVLAGVRRTARLVRKAGSGHAYFVVTSNFQGHIQLPPIMITDPKAPGC
jgi:hypothetical protein